MGTENIGMGVVGVSKSIEYSTPLKIVNPLIKEFSLTRDVCASKDNYKLKEYWTIDDDALTKTWEGNCWMNPPFNRNLGKWIQKAHYERHSGTKVCLFPVVIMRFLFVIEIIFLIKIINSSELLGSIF